MNTKPKAAPNRFRSPIVLIFVPIIIFLILNLLGFALMAIFNVPGVFNQLPENATETQTFAYEINNLLFVPSAFMTFAVPATTLVGMIWILILLFPRKKS